MKITIKNIAEQTGVSAAAVSMALNNKPGVSEKTRDRVIRAAQNLGYDFAPKTVMPENDVTVRFLKISRHGHTINKSHNYFIDAYVEGISAKAAEEDAVMEVEAYTAREPLQVIIKRINDSPQIAGYLILGTELSEEDIQAFIDTKKNIVFVDTFLDYISADFVDMNNTDAVYKLITHFTDMGHSRIGLIKSSVKTRNFKLREKAFHQVIDGLGLKIKDEYIVDVDSTFETAQADFNSYLREKPSMPTAFFAINDIIALGCMRALQDNGYSIPDDVSIAGFDNLPMSTMTSPRLTTINVSKHEIGRTAFDMLLLNYKRKAIPHPRKTIIGGNLIIRESVKNLN